MLILLRPHITADHPDIASIQTLIQRQAPGARLSLSELPALGRLALSISGQTHLLSSEHFYVFAAVEQVCALGTRTPHLERAVDGSVFQGQALTLGVSTFHVIAGLCALDSLTHWESTLQQLHFLGLKAARVGLFKPRTSPYDFQGHGEAQLLSCLMLAAEYGIELLAIEVMHERHIEAIEQACMQVNQVAPLEVMLQIGARNAQNFELLKAVSRTTRPILYKRGMACSIQETLSACEYLTLGGNSRVMLCLRGVMGLGLSPHRYLIDFAALPAIRRAMPALAIAVDPSHSVGHALHAPDGVRDLQHVAAQGVIVGANAILLDVHPQPEMAQCDARQALPLSALAHFSQDMAAVRATYLRRVTEPL